MENQLSRRLKARHLNMIAIGGTIGTGLFMGSGAAIATSGPLGALSAFTLVSIMVFSIVSSLGEMASYIPLSGSFQIYAARFVDPALAFSLGWNYWAQWAVTLPSELSAGSIIISYWSNVPSWIWSILVLMILFLINANGVSSFATMEYWLASIKVVTIVIFVVLGLLLDLGAFGGPVIGFQNYRIQGAPFKNGFFGMVNVFLLAFFAFGGTELVGIAVGEVENPRKNIPRAIYGTCWRILLFYILSIFVIGLIIPHNDPHLPLGSTLDVTVSPFTLVFSKILPSNQVIAHLMNAVILSAVLSAGNSAIYGASRTLMSMANEGKAPMIFGKVNSSGVPMNALIVTCLFGCISLLGSYFGNGVVFQALLNITGISGILTWTSISLIHLRFRQAFKVQQRDIYSEAIYQAPWYPLGNIVGIVMGIAVILSQGYIAIQSDYLHLIAVYLGIPIFAGLFLYYKIKNGTQIVALEEADLDSQNIWESFPEHE